MHRILVFLFALPLFALPASAQREGENWVMGWNAGLRFLPDGTFTYFTGSHYTREGVACISDKTTGNLLFYTDGTQVWDRNHNLMPNGWGLWGNYSAAQSAAIIPKPGSDTRYYIFTAPQIQMTGIPYAYSEVDMTQNGGLGDVIPNTRNLPIGADATEKLTIARHCNNRDFWVIMRHADGNRFSVRLVDAGGVQAAQSFNLGGYVDNSSWTKANYMKMSLDQKLLIHPIGMTSPGAFNSVVEIFNFDNAAGQISGPVVTIDGFQYAYAAELSADNRLLYVSDISTFGASAIYQFDLAQSTPQAIKNSKTLLKVSDRYDYGALQMGPDGKIYVAKEDGYDNGAKALDVIRLPGVPGAGCTYVEDGMPLQQGRVLIGLPNFPNYVFSAQPAIVAAKNCNTGVFAFSVRNVNAGSAVAWNFGDPGSGNNSAAGSQASHTFSQPGEYTVMAIYQGVCGTDTMRLKVTANEFKPVADTSLCLGSSLTLTGPGPNTLWNGSTTGLNYTVVQGGPVSYQITDAYGCTFSDVVFVQALTPVAVSETLLLCQGDTALVFGLPVTQGGTFSQTFTAINGCDSVHTIEVVAVQDTLDLFENPDVCRGDTLYRFGKALFENGLHTFVFPLTGNCVVRHNISVTVRELPVLAAVSNPDGCRSVPAGSIRLAALPAGTQARLNDGPWQADTLFKGLEAGIYRIGLRNIYGCTSEGEAEVPEPSPFIARIEMDTALTDCGLTTLVAGHTGLLPVTYSWMPLNGLDCADCPAVVATPSSDTRYTVTVVDTAGCQATAEIAVPYRQLIHLYAPNVFSPDYDGRNDRFTLYGNRCVKVIRYLSVFDRWGGLAFHRTGLTPGDEGRGWDGLWRGGALAPGVFTWVAEVELINGVVTPLQGSVTLVR